MSALNNIANNLTVDPEGTPRQVVATPPVPNTPDMEVAVRPQTLVNVVLQYLFFHILFQSPMVVVSHRLDDRVWFWGMAAIVTLGTTCLLLRHLSLAGRSPSYRLLSTILCALEIVGSGTLIGFEAGIGSTALVLVWLCGFDVIFCRASTMAFPNNQPTFSLTTIHSIRDLLKSSPHDADHASEGNQDPPGSYALGTSGKFQWLSKLTPTRNDYQLLRTSSEETLV